MSSLTRRTQILLDEARYSGLERRAAATGQSVAAVIRDAIDAELAHDDQDPRRRAAAAELLAAPVPVYPDEPDWHQVKDALRGRGRDR